MDTTMLFPLVLLICSFSVARPETESDNQIIPHEEQSESQRREAANASEHRQTCPQDIHGLLREMSASLAEQRVEMRHLQRDNEAQAAKLRELEEQKPEVNRLKQQQQAQAAKLRELEEQKTEVTRLKQQLQAQAAKLRELEEQKTDVNRLKQRQQAQTAELITIKARFNVTENQVEALTRDGEVKQVAFSASLLASGHGTIGPFNTHTPLVFRHVTTNIGGAYNPNSGFFIAPVRGVYHFEFHIYGAGFTSPSGAALIKNGQQIYLAYHYRPSFHGPASNSVSLLLEVGDVVFMRQWGHSRIYDSQNHHTTFSGHLLFTV